MKETKWIDLLTKKCREFVIRRNETRTEVDVVLHIVHGDNSLTVEPDEFEIVKVLADEMGYQLKSKEKARQKKNEANKRYRERKKAAAQQGSPTDTPAYTQTSSGVSETNDLKGGE